MRKRGISTRVEPGIQKIRLVFSTLIVCLLPAVGMLLAGCADLKYTPAPTPFPVDFIPTIIALTVQAGEQALITPSPVMVENTPTAYASATLELITATEGPSPTPVAYNPSATASVQPSASATLADTSPTPTVYQRATRTPTITPTPTLPVADVRISEPGPMSKIASPLKLVANVHSVPSGSYNVEIWTEPLSVGGEARLLYREVMRIISNPVPFLYLDPHIPFELSRVSEFGQLRISVLDKYGRLASVNSVDLILLAMGNSDITPEGVQTEPIVIREPTLNHLIQGGVVTVSGEVMPSENSLLVELVTYDGIKVGYANVFVTPDPAGGYVPFAVDVPYSVNTPTWVRLQVSEIGLRIPGVEHLSSVEVLVSP